MPEIMVPITFFIMTGLIVIAALILRFQRRRLESQEILAAIEKGVEIKFPEPRNNRLLAGLIWLLTGLVATIAMAVVIPEVAPAGIWIWGLIPVAIGAALLIVYRIERKEAEAAEQS